MTQLGEAIARYHKILENEPYRDLAWADALHEQMVARKLAVAGRPICPFLRPHFVNARQYATLIKGAEALANGGDEAKRAFAAMMTMRKIDVATIDAARRG